ncbi:hypothetical protein [Flavobacterium cerinum]|uniref:Uncharacterized protein n=1 Tax=Flavobacterium cerinum TaxID=2502784 RepID=A0A444HB53_9FLAO|nr:hypothetical protein [Flavobacterium cerinum]RWX00465.1 hypothetical protein EPI11_09325 [Flavobacterium cerinum]
MVKQNLVELFNGMPAIVQEKLRPVMDNLLERAQDLDAAGMEDPDYEDELESITKEVNKVKYLNDQWQIMNAKKSN